MSGRGGDAKRPREDDTDRIVAEALEREALEREAKKSAGKGKGKSKKEKAPVEVPEGPVLEGLLENVHSRRVAQKRDHQGQGDEDTNFVANVRDIETNLEVAEEDGVKFEAFNFEAEREEGHFDEDGHFIWNETNEEGKDAWLDSKDGGKVCSKKAQEQHEQMLQRMKEMDAARPMAPSDIRKLAGEAAGMLLPGETVVQGLRRLGGKGQKKGGKQDKKQASGPQSSEADPVLFARLTEAADTLVGEMDVYAFTREQLEKEAGLVQGGADEADMFADSDEDAPADATVPNAMLMPPNGIAVSPGPVQTAATEEKEDFSGWPISELKRFLKERGEEITGPTEKADLIKRAQEVASRGPEGDLPPAPPGYIYDPTSGYFHSEEHQMYYDANSACFYSPTTQKWYDSNWTEIQSI